MKTFEYVTLYHYDSEEMTYKPRSYGNAGIYRGIRTAVKNGGFVNDGFLRIRIFGSQELEISTEDYVFAGKTDAPIDKNQCFKVVAFGDNRRGTAPHWRIECGQKYRR